MVIGRLLNGLAIVASGVTTCVVPNDAGAITFVSQREVVDLMGLVTPEIRAGGKGKRDWFPELARRVDRFTTVWSRWRPSRTPCPDLL